MSAHPMTRDYAAECLDRELWKPTLLEQLDALELLIRSEIPQALRRACMSRYLDLTDRKALA